MSPDSQHQQLTMTSIAEAEEIKDSTLDCMMSPAFKTFPESRPHCLMSLAFPVGLSKTCRDTGTALMAVDASSAVPSSVRSSVDTN